MFDLRSPLNLFFDIPSVNSIGKICSGNTGRLNSLRHRRLNRSIDWHNGKVGVETAAAAASSLMMYSTAEIEELLRNQA